MVKRGATYRKLLTAAAVTIMAAGFAAPVLHPYTSAAERTALSAADTIDNDTNGGDRAVRERNRRQRPRRQDAVDTGLQADLQRALEANRAADTVPADTLNPYDTGHRFDSLPEELRPRLTVPDSLRATYRYTEGLKRAAIYGDSAAARALYEQALAFDSEFAPALYEMASQYLEKDGARAVEYARRAYHTDTTSRWYTSIYAQALIVTGDYDRALPVFRRLIRMDADNPDNYRIMAILYQQRQQPYSAIAVLDSADMRLGKIPYLSALKRHLLVSTRQYDRAIEEAQQAYDAAPYEQSNVLSLGQAYAAAGRDSIARATLREAVSMDSTNVDALAAYADFCSERGDMPQYLSTLKLLFANDRFPLERKISLFNRLTASRKFYGENYFAIGALASTLAIKYPDDKRVVDLYGDHLIAGGDVENALRHFKLHLGDQPPQMDYYMAVIDIETYLQRPDSVDRYVQRAVELFPGDPVLYIRKANRLYVKGDYDAAVEAFDEALKYADTDSLRGQLWGFIGDTYHQISEFASGRSERPDSIPEKSRMGARAAAKRCYEAYETALRLYPDNASVLNNYAYYLSLEKRDLERALEMSSRAIALEEGNATFIDTYAWILYELGRYDEARTSMRQALSLDRTESAALPLHYGDILYALGEDFMAETYWRKALDMGADSAQIEERLARLRQKEHSEQQKTKGGNEEKNDKNPKAKKSKSKR